MRNLPICLRALVLTSSLLLPTALFAQAGSSLNPLQLGAPPLPEPDPSMYSAPSPSDMPKSEENPHTLSESPFPAASPMDLSDWFCPIVPYGDAAPVHASEAAVQDPLWVPMDCWCPSHYVQVDGLYWQRQGNGAGNTLALNTNPNPDQPVLNANDLGYGASGGVRALIGWRANACSRCCAWELSYFGLFDSDAISVVGGNNNLAIPGALGLNSNNFLNADSITAISSSDFHNLELNCVKSCCTCNATFDWLCGVRFIAFSDEFLLIGDDSADEGVGVYGIDADNYLYGAQVGARYTRYVSNWSFQFTGKAGLFGNYAHQSQYVTDSPFNPGPFPLRPLISQTRVGVAGLGELSFTAIRPINNTWSLRLGYSAIGITGLAIASNQVDFTDVTGVSGEHLTRDGYVVIHGIFGGLEACW